MNYLKKTKKMLAQERKAQPEPVFVASFQINRGQIVIEHRKGVFTSPITPATCNWPGYTHEGD